MPRLLHIPLLLAVLITPVFAQTDIDVLYIQKTPLLNYDAANGGWPAVGSTVTWNAKVKNWGTVTLPAFTCEWWLDGQKVRTDTVANLAAGEVRNVTFQWVWQQSPHVLEFRADTGDVVSEVSESNNTHSITTNALTIGSWVEQSLYDWFHAHQIELGDGANSFDNWCYRMVKRWNELNALAVWPVSPNGIVDRVRIEKVVVVPDGSLPLNGGLATNNPDRFDKTVDLMWGHPYRASDCQPGGFWQVSATGPFFIDYGEIHELNHARYLVDHYGFDVSHDQTTSNILLTDQYGNQVAGTSLMPYSAWNVVYYNKSSDLMGGSNHYGEYAAGAWNRKAGIRGPNGNQNSPSDIGVYLQDLPQNNYFRFIDNTGAPLVGATISVYRATGGTGWYAKYFDNVPDIVATTDDAGTVNLGRCPFSSTGTVTSTYGLSNATFIIKVSHSGQEYFTFQEVSDFGISYWKGNTQAAYYTILVPWGPANISTPVGPNQWRQEIHANKSVSNLVDVKALDPNELGGFALRMADRPISSAVSRDNFSCRFTRDVFLNKGVYKFIMHTDDGGRLYVDGVNYIDDWVDGGVTPRSATVSFDSPALRTIRMDHYESGSVAIAALAIVPPMDTVPGPNDWKMEVFGSPNLSNPVEVAACPAGASGGFALDWGDWGPSVRTGGDGFSVRFSRSFDFAGGTYSFSTVSDDGVRLYVDGELKIDNWNSPGLSEDSVEVELSPGTHELVVETYDASSPARISLAIDHLMPDFDVTYISRIPRYDRYNVSYEYGVDPNEPETGRPYLTPEELAKQRWPAPGETVTYTAHIRNTGVSAAECDYAWYFDGVQVGSGTISSLAPGEETTVSYSRAWDSEFNTHYVKFAADPLNMVPERCETNNVREDAANALSFRLHVWQSVHDWFAANARNYGDLASFEDWAQNNFAHLNRLLAEAVYPGTPQGVTERVRIDEIVVVPDSTAVPDPVIRAPEDWPWDGRLGFTNDLLGTGAGDNYFEQNPAFVSGHDPDFIRRIAPQLGLIDYNALSVPKASNLAVPTVGHLASLTSAAISTGGPFFAEHEAYALAADAHRRRGFRGAFLYDLPAVIRLQVLDSYRRPLPGARVRVYQEYPGRTIPAALRFDLIADAEGYTSLPNRSCFGEFTTVTGHTLRDNPFGLVNTTGENGLFLAEITSGGVTDYQFIEITRLNTAFRLGHADEYTYLLQTNILPGRPAANDLYGVKMLSPSEGYAVGTAGRVLRWDGVSWQNYASPGSTSLLALDVSPDGSTIIATGTGGRLYVNSGSGWVTRTLPSTDLMYCCAALSGSTFLAGGANGKLYRTTNAGVNWSAVALAPGFTGAIRGMDFLDSKNGVLVTASTIAFHTTDGGLTWTPGSGIEIDGSAIHGCVMPTAVDAWAVGGGGSVYKSSSGGASWLAYAGFADQTWYGIDALPDGSGWAVGWTSAAYGTTSIERFENGRWFGVPVRTSGSFSAIYGVSILGPNEAWAVGKAGLILRLVGGSDARFEICDSLAALKALPDGVNVDLTAAAQLRVTAVFPECVYLQTADRSSAIKVYTDDGGVLWAPAVAGGILGTENGERVLRFGRVVCGTGGAEIGPLGMTARAVGGSPNWPGAPNLAILVRIAGKVTGAGPNWVTIDDGSGLVASDGRRGIKVLCDTFGLPSPLPEYVSVTGVATTELVFGQVYPVVRARAEWDLQ